MEALHSAFTSVGKQLGETFAATASGVEKVIQVLGETFAATASGVEKVIRCFGERIAEQMKPVIDACEKQSNMPPPRNGPRHGRQFDRHGRRRW